MGCIKLMFLYIIVSFSVIINLFHFILIQFNLLKLSKGQSNFNEGNGSIARFNFIICHHVIFFVMAQSLT